MLVGVITNVEAAPFTTCVTAVEVLPLKFVSPLYMAVIVRDPVVVNVSAQLPAPAESVAVQFSPVEAETFTVPVGLVIPDTTKLTVTVCDSADGFGVFAVITVVLFALATVSLVLVSLAGPKFASPANE